MKSFRICMQNIRKWASNNRIKMCLALAVLFVYSYTNGIGILSMNMGEKVSPWLFPFLFSFRYMKIVFMAPIVFIFCDAPFIDANQTYIMLRTKRSTWCVGQILYIFAGSFLYAAILFLSTIVFHIGHMEWNSGWGNVLGAAGTTSILSGLNLNYTTISISSRIIRYFTPLQAMIYSFIIMWLSFVFIGLLIYVLNVVTKTKLVGVLVASFLVVLTAVVDGFPYLAWLSPITWNSLNCIDVGGMTLYPSIVYVLGMYIGMITIMIIIAIIMSKKQEIIISDTD